MLRVQTIEKDMFYKGFVIFLCNSEEHRVYKVFDGLNAEHNSPKSVNMQWSSALLNDSFVRPPKGVKFTMVVDILTISERLRKLSQISGAEKVFTKEFSNN